MCLGGCRHSSQNSVNFFGKTLYIWVYLFVRYQIWVKDVQVCVWRCVQTGSFSAATGSVSASSSSVTRSPTAQTEGFYKVFFYFQKLSLVHSDENACSVTEDPNRADVSGFTNLLFETTEPISGVRPCWVPPSRLLLFSGRDSGSRDRRRQTGGGKKILGPTSMWPSQGLTQVTNLPMMITFTFNGAVNDENVRVYDRLFHGGPFKN